MLVLFIIDLKILDNIAISKLIIIMEIIKAKIIVINV